MTTVYFDGLCHLCSREVAHFRRARGAERLAFVDIAAAGFDARAHGVDPVRVHQEMHVRRVDGTLAVGVEAFFAIWRALPGYAWLARAGDNRVVRPLLAAGYVGFAKIRPRLPRRKAAACDTGCAR